MNPHHRFEFSAGVLGCLVWPILFGYILADDEWGKWGIHIGLAIMVIVMCPVIWYTTEVFKYIARGPPLDFLTALMVTVVFSLVYIVGSLVFGWIVYKLQKRNGSNQSVVGARD